MSGIHTDQKFALLHAGRGISLDTYADFAALAESALFQHAIGAHVTAATNPTKNDGQSDEAAYCDALLARLENSVARVRRWVVENYDPKRLRAPEVWPWHDEQSGAAIYSDKWYGFVDSGGLAGSFVGYDSAADAIQEIGKEHEVHMNDTDTYFSEEPEDLGGVACCVLSGRQYVDRLYELCAPGGSGWDLMDYGHWHELERKKACFVVEVETVGDGAHDMHEIGKALDAWLPEWKVTVKQHEGGAQ